MRQTAPPVDFSPKPASKPARKVSIDERIAALDQLAQQRWRAGDRPGAMKAFRSIVRIGGRRAAVELAYAELFALARQSGQNMTGLWSSYLKRFPKGRYAAEASAGLCRLKQGAAADTCWSAHRNRFPGR